MTRPFDDQDPLWTAYALGDLSEQEAATLEHTPESDRWVAELRAVTEELDAELELAMHLAPGVELALSDTQREQLHQAFAAAPEATNKASRFPRAVRASVAFACGAGGLVMAASVLLLVGNQVAMDPQAGASGLHSYGSARPPARRVTPPPPASSPGTGEIYSRTKETRRPNATSYGDRSGLSSSGPQNAPPRDWGTQADQGDAVYSFNGMSNRAVGDPNTDKYEPLDPTAAYGGYRLDQNQDLVHNNFYPSGTTASANRQHVLGSPALFGGEVLGSERYGSVPENDWMLPRDAPLSTFSIDVDTASYSNVRRYLNQGHLPPPDAVRLEELINYFDYDDAEPTDGRPFAVHTELARSPWHRDRQILRVAIQGDRLQDQERPASNLVFLIDVSGSMSGGHRLGLIKQGFATLVEQLDERDRVSIVVYAGATGQVLPPTPGDDHAAILSALDRLQAGGGTNGGAGIRLAYDLAKRSFIKGASNRVILATDGDFNVGLIDQSSLVAFAAEQAKQNIFLTVLGVGAGNLNDHLLEQIANQANGSYAFLDGAAEVKKVFHQDLLGMLHTIAKDVKIQVEFNPQQVAGYRLVGYENRKLAARDFNDDTKDAGEIGAGHSVTALYEVVPAGRSVPGKVDALRYGPKADPDRADEEDAHAFAGELAFVKVRYKEPEGTKSSLLTTPVAAQERSLEEASDDFKFATAVAAFGMLLRRSDHAEQLTYGDVLEWAEPGVRRFDEHGHRAAFVELVTKARALKR